VTYQTREQQTNQTSFGSIKQENIQTRIICPFDEEHIVFSIPVFKFHLKIDIKEFSPNTSRVAKDLLKRTLNRSKAYQEE
jgi:hypothetical protein